jgi:hypothetical protein
MHRYIENDKDGSELISIHQVVPLCHQWVWGMAPSRFVRIWHHEAGGHAPNPSPHTGLNKSTRSVMIPSVPKSISRLAAHSSLTV